VGITAGSTLHSQPRNVATFGRGQLARCYNSNARRCCQGQQLARNGMVLRPFKGSAVLTRVLCAALAPCSQLESERKALQRAAELDKLAAAELTGTDAFVVRMQTGACAQPGLPTVCASVGCWWMFTCCGLPAGNCCSRDSACTCQRASAHLAPHQAPCQLQEQYPNGTPPSA
jgi:hypothetical protein